MQRKFLAFWLMFLPIVVQAQQVVAPSPEPYERPFDENRGVLSYAPIMENALKAVVKLHRLQYSESQKQYVPSGTGSGVVYNRARGLIITNEHVTGGAKSMIVEFDGGAWTEGKVVAESKLVDIALVKVDDFELKHQAVFVDTNTVQVGDLAFAAGFPSFLKKTLTIGIVSGLERRGYGGEKGSRPGRPKIEDFIQTDAAINGGNSGGALLDSEGRVLGINTFILTETEGLGFAIPSNVALTVAERLLQGSDETPGYFGATVDNIRFSDVKRLNLDVNGGVILEDVQPGSPAHNAGLRDNDVVVGAGNRSIADVYQFANYILLAETGVPEKIYYRRDGRKLVATVALADVSGKSTRNSNSNAPTLSDSGSTRQTRRASVTRDLHGASLLETISGGWLITAVAQGSRADRKGLREGDRIVAIDGRAIRNVSDFNSAVDRIAENTSGLAIERDGQRFNIIL